jgi:hypothetical protein
MLDIPFDFKITYQVNTNFPVGDPKGQKKVKNRTMQYGQLTNLFTFVLEVCSYRQAQTSFSSVVVEIKCISGYRYILKNNNF